MGIIKVAVRTREGEQTPTRVFSNKQEKQIAKEFNGKQQKNSGATLFDKGDVVLDEWLIECKTKTTPSQSISIKKEWLEKNNKEALFIGKPYNTLAFNFGPDEDNYYVISEELFHKLVNCLNYLDKGE